FGSCGALTSYMRTKALQVVSPYGLPSSGGGGGLVYAAAAAGRPEAATSQGAAPSAAASDDKAAAPQQAPVGGDEFSTTNVQEAGIDEPDVVKTDGKRLYALQGDTLYVVDAAQPRILGSLKVGYSTDLFLVGDRVVVFG